MGDPSRRRSAAAEQRSAVARELIALVKQALDAHEEPPWRRPWVGGFGQHRAGTKKKRQPYQGWNAWSTWVTAMRNGYRSELWYTRERGEKLHWTLKPNAVGAGIFVPLFSGGSSEEGPTGGLPGYGGDWGGAVVYNRDAFDGPKPEPPPTPWESARGIDRVCRLLRAAGIDLMLRGLACFDHGDDVIGLPDPFRFHSADDWAGTALHELVHWTGFHLRLDRIRYPWSPEERALEELVAELGSAMLSAQLGVAGVREYDDRHRAYLTSWSAHIQRAPEALEHAMEQADLACRFLEALAPEVFAGARREGDVVGMEAAPQWLREGHLWRGDPMERLRVHRIEGDPPPVLLGPAAAAALTAWARAVERWSEQPQGRAPLLVLQGAPGDGAESLLALVHLAMVGAPVPGATWLGADGPQPLELPRVPSRRRDALLLPRRDQDWRLPAWAFLAEGESAPSAADLFAALDKGHSLPVPAALVVRSLPEVERRTRAVFVVDLAREPLALVYAGWRLAKTDGRIWLAVAQRRPAMARRVESWASRLRGSSPWLDAQQHRGRDPLRRSALGQTAPFAPVVLQAAQAVLDTLARLRLGFFGLPALVEEAMRRHPVQDASQIIPLDELLEPLFGEPREEPLSLFDAPPTQAVSLSARARLVVQLLEVCPELSRGTQGLALLLTRSMDVDLDAFGAEIEEAAGRAGRPSGPPKGGSRQHGRLVREHHAWSCTVPLQLGGRPVREA
ncbi:MAG: zincin-like metallopeptidase domain-containing protein [Pseudomonadota bacterium]